MPAKSSSSSPRSPRATPSTTTAAAAAPETVPNDPRPAGALATVSTCLVADCGWPSEADVPARDGKAARRR